MTTVEREEVTIRVDASLLAGLRRMARDGDQELDAIAEDAFRQYAELNGKGGTDDAEVMAHFWDSVRRNYRLGELLSQ